MKKSINITSKELRNILALSRENAYSIARKNADGYIKYNPQDKDRRNYDLQIEICGVDNLYYRILKEIERIESL